MMNIRRVREDWKGVTLLGRISCSLIGLSYYRDSETTTVNGRTHVSTKKIGYRMSLSS